MIDGNEFWFSKEAGQATDADVQIMLALANLHNLYIVLMWDRKRWCLSCDISQLKWKPTKETIQLIVSFVVLFVTHMLWELWAWLDSIYNSTMKLNSIKIYTNTHTIICSFSCTTHIHNCTQMKVIWRNWNSLPCMGNKLNSQHERASIRR